MKIQLEAGQLLLKLKLTLPTVRIVHGAVIYLSREFVRTANGFWLLTQFFQCLSNLIIVCSELSQQLEFR